jgi:hypothetical protein
LSKVGQLYDKEYRMFTLLLRALAFSSTVVFLFSCEKGSSPGTSPDAPINYQLDSIRYIYKDEVTGKTEITSLYAFTYDSFGGENRVSKIKRVDTTDNSLFKAVVYVDKQFSYDTKGQLINIHSKSRRKDLATQQWIQGNSQVENFDIRYDYSIPNIYTLPNAITVDIYRDSSASSIYAHHPFTSVSDFNGYFGPGNIAYYLRFSRDSIGFEDDQNIYWGGPYSYDPGTRTSLYAFIFNEHGYVSEFRAFQTPYYFLIHVSTPDKQDQRRVHYEYDSTLAKLMAGFIGRQTFEYGIASEILFYRYNDLSNHDRFLGVVNQLKTPALSSTDSTIRLDDQGHITQVVEKEDMQGNLTKDAAGRITKVVKQINTVRTEFPVGSTHTSQTFEFYYKH